VIVHTPDGRDELCYPRGPAERTREVVYPPKKAGGRLDNVAYCLEEGTGVQAFIVVAARQPLPAYEGWRQDAGGDGWFA
jgi:hypothetical protein